MSLQSWLADVVLVNDSPDWRKPGDVLIFRNFDDARSYLEHWSDELEDAAFFATGDKLVVAADKHGYVSVDRREPQTDGQEIVGSWLRHSARSVLVARRDRSTKKWRRVNLGDAERNEVLPETIEGLIAYIGFTI
jgi:hypothetical protein